MYNTRTQYYFIIRKSNTRTLPDNVSLLSNQIQLPRPQQQIYNCPFCQKCRKLPQYKIQNFSKILILKCPATFLQ